MIQQSDHSRVSQQRCLHSVVNIPWPCRLPYLSSPNEIPLTPGRSQASSPPSVWAENPGLLRPSHRSGTNPLLDLTVSSSPTRAGYQRLTEPTIFERKRHSIQLQMANWEGQSSTGRRMVCKNFNHLFLTAACVFLLWRCSRPHNPTTPAGRLTRHLGKPVKVNDLLTVLQNHQDRLSVLFLVIGNLWCHSLSTSHI